MKLKSLIVLLLAGIWGVGGWWWYTCKIKGFCGADRPAHVASAAGQGDSAKSGSSAISATTDSDGDGIPDQKEIALGLNPQSKDSDGDGIADGVELARSPQDTDHDGKIDALDNDDDGDGILTKDEHPDPNGDGNVADAQDKNANGVPDYLEANTSMAGTGMAGQGGMAGAGNGLAGQGGMAGTGNGLAGQSGTGMAGQGGMAGAGLAGQGATALTQTADAKAKAEAEKQAADAKAKAEAEKQAAADAKAKAEAEKQAAAKAKEEETKVTIETAPPAAGAPVDDIGPAKLHFPTGSANPQLANETKAYFQKVASYLKAHPQTRITVVGHTDSQGAAAKNEKLGLERAETTKKLLVGNGIPADRLEVSSKGASEPIADNKTDAGRKKNRRVEITPIK